MTPAAFERKMGFGNATISQAIKNGTQFTVNKLVKILQECDELSADWLMTGNGKMLKSVAVKSLSDEGVPLIPVSAAAGDLTGNDFAILKQQCEHYIIPAFKGATYIIQISGDSMIPKFIPGEMVVCKTIPLDNIFFQWGHAYVISTIQGALLKYIKPGSSKDSVLIVSENKNYDPFELPLTQIHQVAIVLGSIRTE